MKFNLFAVILVACLFLSNRMMMVDVFATDSRKGFIVREIIDGDTIQIADNETTLQIRILGIDTPEIGGIDNESQCLAYDAKFFAENVLAQGKKVLLTSDPQNRDRDELGRLLRYVDIVGQDGSTNRLNELLVQWGLARVAREFPLSQKNKYLMLEREARRKKVGIWGKCKMSRYEFTKIVVSYRYSQEEIKSCEKALYVFPDVPQSEWYSPYVCLARKQGLVHGYADGYFRGTDYISLAESLKIILEGFKKEALLEQAYAAGSSKHWYRRYMEAGGTFNMLDKVSENPNHRIGWNDMAELMYEGI